MAKVGIETTQHVQLSQDPAGVTERILAYILDFIVLGVFYFVLWYITVDSGLLNNVIENQWVCVFVLLVFDYWGHGQVLVVLRGHQVFLGKGGVV